VAGEAKPTAKPGEKFQYQNIMYITAEKLFPRCRKHLGKIRRGRIFKPLGMSNSSLTDEEMHKSKDYSLGYDYNPDTKETINLQRTVERRQHRWFINSSARIWQNGCDLCLTAA
jgi:CubicO group peptidase (beta-lactamase class C family)